MSSLRGRLYAALVAVLATAVGCLLIAVGPTVMFKSIGALLVVALVPGALLATILCARCKSPDWIEFAAIAVGLGIVAMVLGTYALHIVPGPLSQSMILSAYVGLDLALVAVMILSRRIPKLERPTWSRKQLIALLVIVILASALRLPLIGYSEFQGDEGRAALRAAEVLLGYDEVLLLHKKGPVEIILPTAMYAATQRLTEATARMPLGLANVAFLVALAYVGRRLFSPWAGLIAAAILTVDGFIIGFSRLLQYQSVILLTTTLVVLLLHRATEEDTLDRWLVWAAALLGATALLAHYEGIMVFPAALWLIWRWMRRTKTGFWRMMGNLVLPIIGGGALVALFYIPFVLHPQFAATSYYLTERRVGRGVFYSNLADYFQRASFYSSTYYVIGIAGALAIACAVLLWRRYAGRRWRWALLALIPLWISALGWPSLWTVGLAGPNLTVLLYAATFALAWFALPGDDARTVLVWFGAPALFYFYMMTKVHTHYYGTLPGWTLLVGCALAVALERVDGKRVGRAALVGVMLVWWGLCIGYVGVAFCRTWPEWKPNYPMVKPALYWSPYVQPPQGGYFGFPYRTAWKAIGALYAEGTLAGSYDSNQEDLVTNWYTRGELRVKDSERFIVARDLENAYHVPEEMIDGSYMPMVELTRDGRGQLFIFGDDYDGPMRSIATEELARTFDEELSAPVFRIGAPLDDRFAAENVLDARLGEAIILVGWSLDNDVVPPGGQALLTLYWYAVLETDAGYNVFASLGDENPIVTLESAPQGGENPTFRWEQGDEVVDRHLVEIGADAPEGVYPLRLGMVDFLARERLSIQDAVGNELGTTLYLTDIRIGAPTLVEALPDAASCAALGESVLVEPVPAYHVTAKPGDTIELDITWYASQPLDRSLTVFVQCLGPDGRPYGQVDTLPRGGSLPTNHWAANERIEDTYAVTLRGDAPAGAYGIVLGLYDPATGVREPVVLRGELQPDGMLAIGTMEVSE